MKLHELPNPILIAGPCALESRCQALATAANAQARGIKKIRMPRVKPRTGPGWDGIGDEGLEILAEVAQMGLTPATEVLMPVDADKTMEKVLGSHGETNLILWLGARNFNHIIQQSVGRAIGGEPRVKLGIKNPMWGGKEGAEAWIGAVMHVISCGTVDPAQLMLIHRGFAPSTESFRNQPDFDLAVEVAEKVEAELGFRIPLLGDPSHIAGKSPENVMAVAQDIANFEAAVNHHSRGFDGIMVEVYPSDNPAQDAKTDKNQQLTWTQWDQMIHQIGIVVGQKNTVPLSNPSGHK